MFFICDCRLVYLCSETFALLRVGISKGKGRAAWRSDVHERAGSAGGTEAATGSL